LKRSREYKRDSVTRFSTSGFFYESVSPKALEYTIRAVSNFCQNSRRYLQIKVHHQMKKIFNQKSLNYFFGTPLCSRINIKKNLPPVSLILVMHLHLRMSPQIFEKIRNDPNVIFGGLGKDDS
jgi:hypothetical protein